MFWKIYFWAATILTLLGMAIGLIELTNTGVHFDYQMAPVDLIDFIAIALGLIGVYGYAFKRSFGTSATWFALAIAIITYHSLFSFTLDQRYGAFPAKSVGDALFTFVPFLPMYAALYLYVVKLKAANCA